jgi:hypothetical protein
MATKKRSTKKRASKKAGSKRAANAVAGTADSVVAPLALTIEAIGQFRGTAHFESVAAILIENGGGASPLIMFRPAGNHTPADIGAAASFLHHVLGKQEGDPVTIVGHRGPIFGQQFIFVISAS